MTVSSNRVLPDRQSSLPLSAGGADSVVDPPRRPLVLGSILFGDSHELQAAIIEGFAFLADRADGLELRFPDESLTIPHQIDVADQLGAACATPIFIRADVPMAAGNHQLIMPRSDNPTRRQTEAIHDLGIDELDHRPSSAVVGERWRDAEGHGRFSISTGGFDALDDGELIALATITCARGAAAIITDRVRTVRRVVDTITPVMAAKSDSSRPGSGLPTAVISHVEAVAG